MMESQTGRAKNARVKFTIPINLGIPIAIKAYINQLKEPITYVIEMNPREKAITEEVKDYIVNKVENDPWGTGELIGGIIIFGTSALKKDPRIMAFGLILWMIVEGTKTLPEASGDNNLIMGDNE